MSKIPSIDVLESLYKLRIRESVQLKTVLEFYEMEIHQKISMAYYQKLKTMVKRRKDQIFRLRNFDARRGRIETGVIKNRKGTSGVDAGKGTCYQWKEASVRKETDAVSGMKVTNVPKTRTHCRHAFRGTLRFRLLIKLPRPSGELSRQDGWNGLEAQDVFEFIRTGLRSPEGSSTRQKDEAYLWNQHQLKHTGRWERWKTMPGTCDKRDTELLRMLMCRKATSRQCLTS